MTTQLATAAVLTGILIYKVYRRRHPLPPAKVPHTIRWTVPKEHREKCCELYDNWMNNKGSSAKDRYAFWAFVTDIAGEKWPKDYTGKIEFDCQVPVFVFAEKLED